MTSLFILILPTLMLAGLCSLIFKIDSKSNLSKAFAFVALTSFMWSLTNYCSNLSLSSEISLIINKTSLYVGFLLIISVWVVSLLIPKNSKVKINKLQLIISIVMLIILTSLMFGTDVIISDVKPVSGGVVNIVPGRLFFMYSLFSGLYLMMIVVNFYKKYVNASITQKYQIIFASTGLIASFLWAVSTAIVIPSISNDWRISKFGTIGTVFAVWGVAHAIVRHKLFNLTRYVVAGFIHTVTIACLSAAYIVTSYLLQTKIQSIGVFSAELSRIIIFISFALMFLPLKRLFDKITYRYFYQSHYDLDSSLKAVNATLSRYVELDALLEKVGSIIESSLNTSYMLFIENSGIPKVLYASGKPPDGVYIDRKLDKLFDKSSFINVSNLTSAQVDDRTYSSLRNVGMAAIVRLRKTSVNVKSNLDVYLVIGDKKNGKSVNVNDEKFLDIASGHIASAIQNALYLQEIVDFNKNLQSEINIATKNLKQSNKELADVNKTKDELLAMATHQIYPQLSAAKGFVEILQDEVRKNQNKEYLSWVHSGIDRSLSIVGDMLSISQFANKTLITNMQNVDIVKLLEKEVQTLKPIATSENIHLMTQFDTDIVVKIDKNKVKEVIANLIRNGISYSDPDSVIEIKAWQSKSFVNIEIRDYGIGVRQSEIQSLFTKNFRAPRAKKKRPEGMGVGLYLAKKVIDSHGGKIYYQRPADGAGSIFGFKLRLERPEA